MSWTNFTTYMVVAYLLYYALNIIMDLLAKRSNGITQTVRHEKFEIADYFEPVDASQLIDQLDPFTQQGSLNSGLVKSTGAQTFDGLMAAAAKESIEFTKQIFY